MATTSTVRRAFSLAIALYLVWVVATYLLEGRILTLQRREATGARLAYALVANMLIGIGGSVLVVRAMSNTGVILPRQAGFQSLKHASLAVVAGAVLGFARERCTSYLISPSKPTPTGGSRPPGL